ncbi:peptide ABC transporter substrate-binding protein [Patescibacteria group bacterium]|nr:peptide ABC transporter substrate-binding protein [Patescibacteria group bacterium]MBU1662985.1 peptide ABC transporter substrate-binding protein [Patescibacteria group bacterium]MBU1934191.1 peptide ABC transporter substrate-binding protein [Patescibacteria group bacterium]
MNSLKNKIIQFFNKIKGFKNIFSREQAQEELDKKLVFSLAKSRWPSFKQLKYVKKYLNPTEQLAIGVCLAIILFSSIFSAARFYKTHLQVIPIDGGDYIEGVIGSIKYINPLYSSFSDLDSDIAELVYSSLFKRNGNVELVNDLAQEYKISPDGKVYTIKVRSDAIWHNGNSVTVDDVIFTFEAIKNIRYKSPLRTAFTGVEISKVDDKTIKFNLTEPYAAFLDLLSFGILPQELWQQIEPTSASLAELNLKPVGSGRYKFKSLVKDKSGNLRTYILIRNESYYGSKAHINTVNFKLFGNLEEVISALNNNLIDGLSYLPEQDKNQVVAQDSLNFYNLSLPKFSAIFFNSKSNSALTDKRVRQALAYSIDKNKIINEVMAGNARIVDGPILPNGFAYDNEIKKYDYNATTSGRLLAEAGWKIIELTAKDITQAQVDLTNQDEIIKKQAEAKIKMGTGKWLIKDNNYLIITLVTADNQEYGQVAELIAKFWNDINVKTEINLVPVNQIQAGVIKSRNFNGLIFGEMTGADPDPYGFWHSSQIGQSGLNIADYANKEVDKLLEDGRLSSDLKVRKEKYQKFQKIIAEDEPAIFLYSPNYTYVQSKKIKGFNIRSIILPSDRFGNIDQWYINTGKKIIW